MKEMTYHRKKKTANNVKPRSDREGKNFTPSWSSSPASSPEPSAQAKQVNVELASIARKWNQSVGNGAVECAAEELKQKKHGLEEDQKRERHEQEGQRKQEKEKKKQQQKEKRQERLKEVMSRRRVDPKQDGSRNKKHEGLEKQLQDDERRGKNLAEERPRDLGELIRDEDRKLGQPEVRKRKRSGHNGDEKESKKPKLDQEVGEKEEKKRNESLTQLVIVPLLELFDGMRNQLRVAQKALVDQIVTEDEAFENFIKVELSLLTVPSMCNGKFQPSFYS